MKYQNKLAQFKQSLKQLTTNQLNQLQAKHAYIADVAATPYNIVRAFATISVFALLIVGIVSICSTPLVTALIACSASIALFGAASFAGEMIVGKHNNLAAACQQELQVRKSAQNLAINKSNTNLNNSPISINLYSATNLNTNIGVSKVASKQQSATFVTSDVDITCNR